MMLYVMFLYFILQVFLFIANVCKYIDYNI